MRKCLLSLILLCLVLPHVKGVAAQEEVSIEKIQWNLSKEEMVITFFDLSSGEAMLVQTGYEETILINTGGPETMEELLSLLEMVNVLKIDTLILTSLEKEFISNLLWVNKSYLIDEVIVPSSHEQQWKSFEFQHPNVRFWNEDSKKETRSNIVIRPIHVEEDKGMSIHLTFGKHDFLLMGAANEQVEEALLEREQLHGEILKVAEFAKAGGTSEYFLERVDPHVAIIFRERKKLPSADVLERLNETWIDIYQTRQFGNVSIRCDKESYEVMTFEAKERKK